MNGRIGYWAKPDVMVTILYEIGVSPFSTMIQAPHSL